MGGAVYVFVLGGPGSGKGTLCQELVKTREDWVHLGVGDAVRKEARTESAKGREWMRIMEEGRYLSSEDIISVIEAEIQGATKQKFLIDGFPRAQDQIDAFEAKIGDYSLAVFLDVDEDTLRDRLRERGKESDRVDDKDATIETRLSMFNKTVFPCLDHFRKSEKLASVSGESDSILDQVNEMLEKLDEKSIDSGKKPQLKPT